MPAGDNSLIAIDLALVPPERVQERARRINQELVEGGLQLDTTHVPHLTLAQCFVWRASLPMLIERLSLEWRSAAAVPITALALVEQESTVTFLLDRTPELLELHVRLMEALRGWEEEGGDASAFYSEGEPARDKDVDWVANFRTAASYRKFIPHITLGFGRSLARSEPFHFLANQLGLFHLGRFCSCRALLKEWRLR